MKRCSWVNEDNPVYIKYHDLEWGIPSYDDRYLFEMLVLETFQAGLSWECILNKREGFKKAFDNFNSQKISHYDENKINELLENKNIVRNRLKIISTINNAKVFMKIIDEYGGFSKYIWHFTNNRIINSHNPLNTKSVLSDQVSQDLKRHGMSFVGSTIIYSYLQAIGIINDHSPECDFKN